MNKRYTATSLGDALKLLEPYFKIQKQLNAIVPPSMCEIAEQQKRWDELSGASVFSKIQKQLDAIVPPSIREIAEQQKRWDELSGASVFSKLDIIPSIGKTIPFIDWSQFNQSTSAFGKILKVQQELERYLTLEEREQLRQEAKVAQERLRAMASEPENVEKALQEVENNAEIMQAVLCGDEKAISTFSSEQIKQALILIFNILSFLSILSAITGYSFKDLFQSSPQEIICEQYHAKNVENAEIRKVRLNKGTLNVRQYPNEKGKILAELPNGELICLPNKPKGNQRWLKVNIKDDNNNIITGYVNVRFTEKITFINGEKL